MIQMQSASVRRRIRQRDGFLIDTRLSVAVVPTAICILLLFFDTTLALSTTNPITPPKVSAGERIPYNIPITESSIPEPNSAQPFLITPDERSEILNKHLRRELSSIQQQQQQQQPPNNKDGNGIVDIGSAMMEAALVSARHPSQGYDPRFGRPALRAYRSFVYSDQHANDPLLLDGLAIKTAKQIRNMMKQTINLRNGIVSPPKNNGNDNPPQHFREKIANSIAKGERRARERNNRKLREICKGCSRPFNLCLCEVLDQYNPKSSSNATTLAASERMVRSQVIVLQHPNEFRKKHTSTVPLLKLVLGDENVRIKVGYDFTMKDIVLSDETNQERPIMLFPGPDAIDLDKYVELQQENQQMQQQSHDSFDCKPANVGKNGLATTPSHPKQQKKNTLVLIDGTWSEAKRIIRRSPEILEGCQMVQFAFDDDLDEEGRGEEHPNTNPIDNLANPTSSWPTQPESDSDKAIKSRSIYHAMRKEPEEHCLSTLEACGEALKILEGEINGPKLQEALTSVLSKHVELHLKNARDSAQARHSRDTASRESKLQRSKEIEQSIYGGKDDGGGSGDSSSSHPNQDSGLYNGQAVEPTTIAGTPTRLLEVDSNTKVTIRRLTHEDIPVIDAWWENGGTPKSKTSITRSIDADYRLGIGASLGIVDETTGALVACILRYESGPLGILHVAETHREKGYGTALLREATKTLVSWANGGSDDRPLECTAFIKDGNTPSEKVFARVGFVRENPNAKRRTGKRRANRKWIYKSPLPTKEGETFAKIMQQT